MSRNVRKRTFRHAHTRKTQISLRICTVRVFVFRMKKLCILGYPKCAQGRVRSDCANVQSDLILRWAHMSEARFQTLRFRCLLLTPFSDTRSSLSFNIRLLCTVLLMTLKICRFFAVSFFSRCQIKFRPVKTI